MIVPSSLVSLSPMRCAGRGRHYTLLRGTIETALAHAYRGGWPATLARAARLQRGVRVVQLEIAARAWPNGAPPLRIAFASDFHAGPTTHPAQLDDACRALDDLHADVLLLGGDYVFLEARHVDTLAPRLAKIRAPLGKFAVLGNHDLWADDAHVVRALAAAGVRVLVNRAAQLPAPFAHVHVCGLDDAWVGAPDAARAFEGAHQTRILLMHAPSGLLAIADRPFDVAFCGHTHGGHVALPGGVPIVAPGPLSRKFPHGVHPTRHGPLVVSRGVGGVEIPLRAFAPPDVIACTLTAS